MTYLREAVEYGTVCVPIHDVLTRALFASKKHDEAVLKTYLFSLFSDTAIFFFSIYLFFYCHTTAVIDTAIEFNSVKAWKMT